MAVLVLDTAVLIGLERMDALAQQWLERLERERIVICTAAVCVAEAWRGGRTSAMLAKALKATAVVPTTLEVAKLAGELLSEVDGSATLDALVVATAAEVDAAVLTADEVDLASFASRAGVKVIPFP